ncbi:binding-protein-dependent transport systems inner membrane component [Chloroherpeton thalassium ATCC 35110]|uniref:Binding-protein-dependent transport systems inner membrane component n=1 Tax=Chloroherpeton thalassium (strain ATCC 35110 / GB-78) TaxID=517418 RepID=B3QX60_CHLT3|nr:binding-protein-dependent transport systems inner membrane component [Chloroherpeton thalassium ATCC 35110]
MGFRRSLFILLNVAVLFVLVGYVVFPSLYSVWESLGGNAGFSVDAYLDIFSSDSYFSAILNTILLSAATVVGAGFFGGLLSYIFWRFDFPYKNLLHKIFLLPLGLPPLVGVFSFLFLYSESGILPRLIQNLFSLDSPPFSFDGFGAVLIVHVYSFFVHFFLFSLAGLSKFDYSMIEAAQTLGTTKLRTLTRVMLPMLRPSVVSASLMVFILSTASFTAPLLFASRERYLTVEIFNQKLNGNFEIASALTVVLIFISIAVLYLFEKQQGEKLLTFARRGASAKVAPKPITPLFAGILSLQFLFVILPILTLLLMSFSASDASKLAVIPDKYSLENYLSIFQEENFYRPFVNSLEMAILAGVPNLIFGFIAGALVVQKETVAKPLMSVLLLLPLAIPATALAINLIATFNKPSPLALGNVLVASSAILPLAYFIRNIPYVSRSVSSTLATFDYSLIEAGLNLGASFIKVIGRIVLPIILSSIASGFLFTFINAIGEFPCSVLLYNAENKPVSVEIFSELRLNEFGVASAQGVLLMLLIFAFTWIFGLVFKTRNKLSSFDF